MAIEVFSRYECKFLINKVIYEKMLNRLLEHMELDEHNKSREFYTISNIYYDTDDNQLIRNSLVRPSYKEKLRLRAYGVPESDEEVFLEIKKKVHGLVNKRRTRIMLNEAYEFIESGQKPVIKDYMNKQVLNEIQYILKFYDLKPKLYLAYDRKAMFDRDNHDLRITFDTNIRTRRYDLKLESGDHGESLIPDDHWLMEVKAGKNMPLWLSRMLSEYKVYKTSFSKYGNEYEKFLLSNRKLKGEMKKCLRPYLTPYQVQSQLTAQYHGQPQY